jgi:hypothetical protein
VPPGEATEVAQKLLAAAAELGLPAAVVKTASDGEWGFSFIVPDEVAELAYHGWGADAAPGPAEDGEPKPPKRKPGRPRKAAASNDEKPEEGE